MIDDLNINDIPKEELEGKKKVEISKFYNAQKKTVVANSSTKKKKKPNPKESINNKTSYNSYELYKFGVKEVPKLLNPFLQKVGLAALVGTSDSGKSTFLRQLALSIVLNLEKFLGFKLESTHKNVIYVSTEDEPSSLSFSLRKQIDFLKNENNIKSLEGLKNLDILFDTDRLLENLSNRLKDKPVDLIIIDAFSDVFTKELNANTQVRAFLNAYDVLAKKHKCLILFLHHIGKRTTSIAPSKDSIIGSQGFEAKMRVVLEIRPNYHNREQKDLWVLKSNFLQQKHKSKSYILNFNKELIFENTSLRGSKQVNAKSNNPALIKKVLELNKKGFSYRKIEEELTNSPLNVSKSVIGQIIKKNKDN